MTTSLQPVNAPAAIAPCVCTDPEADKLRELVAGGMDQREASRLLWGPKAGDNDE